LKELVPDKIFKEPNTKNTMARYLQAAVSKGSKKKDAQQEKTDKNVKRSDLYDDPLEELHAGENEILSVNGASDVAHPAPNRGERKR